MFVLGFPPPENRQTSGSPGSFVRAQKRSIVGHNCRNTEMIIIAQKGENF